jgi:hypothetical protein
MLLLCFYSVLTLLLLGFIGFIGFICFIVYVRVLSSIGSFWRTEKQGDGRTDRVTTSLLELLIAAKNRKVSLINMQHQKPSGIAALSQTTKAFSSCSLCRKY